MILIVFTYSIFLSGCWNRQEIDSLAIVTAVGIDKDPEGYNVTTQILNPGEIASQKTLNTTTVTTYSTSGKTVFEAFRRLTVESPRKMYFSHIRIVALGEELAKDDIGKVLDFLLRQHEFRSDYYIIITKDVSARQVLSLLTPIERIPANKIYSSLKISEKLWAPTRSVQLDELISVIMSGGKNAVLTGTSIKGNINGGTDLNSLASTEREAIIKFDSLAAFKDTRLVGWLNEDESKGYNYITDNVKSTVGYVELADGGTVTVELKKSKSKMTAINQNGALSINVDVEMEGEIGEIEGDIDISKQENIRRIEQLWGEKNEYLCYLAIKKAQQTFKSDIFGFGNVVHRTYPDLWKKIKNRWGKEFENLPVTVHSTLKVKSFGTTTSSFLKNKSE